MPKNEKAAEEIERIEWLVRIRWFILLCIILILFIAKFYGGLVFPVTPCLLIWAAGMLYNLMFQILLIANRKFGADSFHFIFSGRFTFIRTNFDFLFITLLVYFTGGIESPFFLLYLLDILTTAMDGNLSLSFLLSGEIALLYGTLLNLEAFKVIPHVPLTAGTTALHLDSGYVLVKVFSLFILATALIFATTYLVQRIKQKQDKIQELSEAKTDFVNAVSHELKNPLTAIYGYTSLLMDEKAGNVSSEQRDFLTKVQSQTKRIIQMVSELLNVSRIEAGYVQLSKAQANLVQIVNDALEEVQPQLAERKINVKQDTDPNLPAVNVDSAKIEEAIVNLLSNAIKFSKEKGSLYLSLKPYERDQVIFSLRDEGAGITKEDISKIFTKFYRAISLDPKVKGTGLGLALCKSIIELHGGRIWAESPGADKGATFSFVLPIK